MNMNFNMNLISIILYLCGILGILVSFLFIILAIKKNTKASSVLVVIMFLLSIILLGTGTCLKLIEHKKNPPKEVIAENTTSNRSTEIIDKTEPSYDDLKFSYKLASSYNSSKKNANITIKNTSDYMFSGEVTLDFTDSNNQSLDSLTLKIKNLLPKKSYNPDALVSSAVLNINYSFDGKFDSIENVPVPYSISKISTGNNFARINVLVDDTSQGHLEQICNVIAGEYTNTALNGLLIYFYSSNASGDLNFENAVADYYLDTNTNTSKFTYY